MGGVTNEAAVGLPPLTEARRRVWDYYRIEFLPDGYPGKRIDADTLSPHPIYGTYVIADYLGQYTRTKAPELLAAAQRVADASIARMEARDDALIFMYQPGTGISSMPHRFYSGLTQSRYLQVLGRLAARTGDAAYREAGAAVFRSLLIPVEEGGVRRETPGGGTLIEEYTHDVPDYTLNGWTTATLLVDEYARLTDDAEAAELVRASRAGIADVLPLYDVPELANTRYRLTGEVQLRLDFDDGDWQVPSADVVIPWAATLPIQAVGSPKWTNRFLAVKDPRRLLIQALICRATWPRPNRISAEVRVPRDTSVTVSVGMGDYDPSVGTIKPTRFQPLTTVPLRAGANRLDVGVPWEELPLTGYPTTFSKRIGGEWFNQYHFIHIESLQKLHALEASDLFRYYARRWAGYAEAWPTLPVYSDAGVALRRHDSPPPGEADAASAPAPAPQTPTTGAPQGEPPAPAPAGDEVALGHALPAWRRAGRAVRRRTRG